MISIDEILKATGTVRARLAPEWIRNHGNTEKSIVHLLALAYALREFLR
jgi:hypothetical protein